ncbi:unnamed protein product [Prunus brigantina]
MFCHSGPGFFSDPLCPFVLGGDEKLGRPAGILHLDDAHPDIYSAFEGNEYSHAGKFLSVNTLSHLIRK